MVRWGCRDGERGGETHQLERGGAQDPDDNWRTGGARGGCNAARSLGAMDCSGAGGDLFVGLCAGLVERGLDMDRAAVIQAVTNRRLYQSTRASCSWCSAW